MNEPELEQLIELARRRVLTAAEQVRLTALLGTNPKAWPDRAEATALTRLLARLPDAPLASNFSTRVMRSIELEDAQAARATGHPIHLFRRWFVRLAWGTAAVALSFTGWVQYRSWQRAEYARSITAISEVAAGPSVEVLRDFEAVQSFTRAPSATEADADLKLLALLQ